MRVSKLSDIPADQAALEFMETEPWKFAEIAAMATKKQQLDRETGLIEGYTSCAMAAAAAPDGKQVPANPPTVRELNGMAWNGETPPLYRNFAYAEYGDMLLKGEGGPTDPTLARASSGTACDPSGGFGR